MVPPANWVANPSNLALNQVWYIDPVNGKNANDGASAVAGGGHGPWHDPSLFVAFVSGGGGFNANALLKIGLVERRRQERRHHIS